MLWESATEMGPRRWKLSGLTDNYLRVRAQTPRELWNTITPVRLNKLHDSGFEGELVGV